MAGRALALKMALYVENKYSNQEMIFLLNYVPQ